MSGADQRAQLCSAAAIHGDDANEARVHSLSAGMSVSSSSHMDRTALNS